MPAKIILFYFILSDFCAILYSVIHFRRNFLMDYVFVINPVAGKGGMADDIARDIRDFFANREENVNIYLSKCPGDAIRFGKEYPIPEGKEVCFVACGGDGTFYEVVNGAFGRPGASFAVYPCGSGNDFIKSIGGKKEDYLDFKKLVDGKIKICDAMKVNGHICSNLCNIGIDSIICDRITHFKTLPGISGQMAYNLSTFTTIGAGAFGHMGFPMTITFDDGESISGRYMLSVFGNGKVYGGGYYPVPDAEIDDGFIDFCSIKEVGVIKASELIGKYKAGKHVGNPKFDNYLEMRRCNAAHVESPVDLTVCVDGEIFKSKSVDIKIIPASLPFLVPAAD